ncbi:hypothetical protein JHK86_018060 [Glycine max]|nr:hypothetical protein JHK86_018060 [Glycine max]
MSEIYFPHWIFKRLKLGSDLRLEEEIAPEENEIAKRLAIVGLWCIQTFPNDRPTMSRVIDMLEDVSEGKTNTAVDIKLDLMQRLRRLAEECLETINENEALEGLGLTSAGWHGQDVIDDTWWDDKTHNLSFEVVSFVFGFKTHKRGEEAINGSVIVPLITLQAIIQCE